MTAGAGRFAAGHIAVRRPIEDRGAVCLAFAQTLAICPMRRRAQAGVHVRPRAFITWRFSVVTRRRSPCPRRPRIARTASMAKDQSSLYSSVASTSGVTPLPTYVVTRRLRHCASLRSCPWAWSAIMTGVREIPPWQAAFDAGRSDISPRYWPACTATYTEQAGEHLKRLVRTGPILFGI